MHTHEAVFTDPSGRPASEEERGALARFLDALPPDVDPCGENGEFHTCVTAGPMFGRPLEVECGEVVSRDGFVFADLVRSASASGEGRSQTA